ncbi:hypothetical protein AKA01nite_12120 [Alkalibacterium kapii]|uniref:Peptide methionine sulfoxide reductase MsrA n=1 Tax=Alkalibacterium kapii TaxID=426704 RepID=A0A511ATS3_9LACT|nr:hypothetical protein AKA01nite_12120 [Alkalibacterium kapii]
MEKALFAGGCFWCMVQPFETMKGIEKVVSGYTGGHVKDPTYEQVKSQKTGHTEAVLIYYDERILSYDDLLTIYWQQTDPTDAMGQFMDRGDSYRPVIFYYDEHQKQKASASKARLQESNDYAEPIVTKIEKAGIFTLRKKSISNSIGKILKLMLKKTNKGVDGQNHILRRSGHETVFLSLRKNFERPI